MVEDLHRQRVLNFLDVFYAGDIEGALSRCTDDVDFFANAPIDILPHMGHHRGKDELRTMWQTVHARYSNMRYEVPILVAEGDKVAANIQVFFRKSSDDRVVQFDIAAFYTLSRRPYRGDSRDHGYVRSGPAGAGTRRRRGSAPAGKCHAGCSRVAPNGRSSPTLLSPPP